MSEDTNNGPGVKPHDVAPGIYFGMDEDFYHSSTSNGSSDMKRLSYSPPDWWFESKFNPLWEAEKLTPGSFWKTLQD